MCIVALVIITENLERTQMSFYRGMDFKKQLWHICKMHYQSVNK